MLWLTIWFTVILKIPAIYLAYVIWWSVKTRLPRPLAERGRVSVAEGSSHRASWSCTSSRVAGQAHTAP